jgi:hypothetical protein
MATQRRREQRPRYAACQNIIVTGQLSPFFRAGRFLPMCHVTCDLLRIASCGVLSARKPITGLSTGPLLVGLMLGSVRDSHRLRVRMVSFAFTWQRVCLSIRFRGVSSEWSGSTAENSPQQRQSPLRSSGWTPRRATRSTCSVSWVDQAAAPVGVHLEAPAVVRPADSPSV